MKTQLGYIYRVRHRASGKVYVGQRRGEFERNYFGSGKYIRAAVAHHGREAFDLEFVQSGFTAQSLDILEKHFIAEARAGGECYNLAKGGNGGSGSPSPEARAKLSAALKGRIITPEARAKISAWRRGRPMPRAVVEKSAASRRGKPISSAHRKALIAANIGRTPTAQTREKLSAWQRGRKMSPQACANMRAAHLGKKHSPEYKAKMSAILKASWIRRKAQ